MIIKADHDALFSARNQQIHPVEQPGSKPEYVQEILYLDPMAPNDDLTDGNETQRALQEEQKIEPKSLFGALNNEIKDGKK